MTILHLRSADIYGSPERLIIGQCRHLPSFDFVCASFVRGQRENRFLRQCEKNGLLTATIRESFVGDFRVIRQIRQVIEQHDVSLLVSHDYKSNFCGCFATRRAGIKQVAYFHGVTSEDVKVGLYNLIDKFTRRRMDRVIAVSAMTARFLQAQGLPSDKIEVVPNAVDPATFSYERPLRSDAEGRCRIVAVGRFSREKGFDLLLEAASAIRCQAPPFELLLYGVGPEEQRLRDRVGRLGLGDVVRFGGFVDDILPILREVDFMVMPSRSEGMPVGILEAWSQQVGVLATSVGGIPEMIESGRSGLLVPPENVAELSDKLLWALNHRDRMDQFGRAGYDTLNEKYTYTVQAERLASIYSEVIAQKVRHKPANRSARL